MEDGVTLLGGEEVKVIITKESVSIENLNNSIKI